MLNHRVRVAQIRRLLIPAHRFGVVFVDALAIVVEKAEAEHRIGAALLRRDLPMVAGGGVIVLVVPFEAGVVLLLGRPVVDAPLHPQAYDKQDRTDIAGRGLISRWSL